MGVQKVKNNLTPPQRQPQTRDANNDRWMGMQKVNKNLTPQTSRDANNDRWECKR